MLQPGPIEVQVEPVDGLHRQRHVVGQFAMTRDTYPPTSVFHIHMARQDVDVPQKDCSGEAIFAVQTGTTKKTGVLNYVLVASSTNAGLTH